MERLDILVANKSSAGELLHFGAVRMRVTGTGNLRMTLNSLDDVNTSTLPVLPMSATTNREPTVLANYVDQLGSLEFETTEIDEVFAICKIVVFVRPVATGYPQ